MKITTQVVLSYFLIVGMAATFFLYVLARDIEPGVTQAVEESLVDTSNILAELAAPDLSAGRISDGVFARAVRAYSERHVDAQISGLRKTSLDYRVMVTDRHGTVVFDSTGKDVGADYSRWNDVYLSLRQKYGARSTWATPGDRGSAVMYVAAPIYEGREVIGVLSVAKPDATIAPFIERATTTVRTQGIILLASAAAIGLFFSYRLTRSIDRLRRYARGVAAGDRIALPATMNREVAELGRALEGMREQLDGKQYVEDYVHALTHELKSPVAAIQGAAELLGDEISDTARKRFAASIGEEAERLRTIADRMLELARVEHLHNLESPQIIDLGAVTARVISDLETSLTARHIACVVQGRVAPISGDPFLVQQALRNLLENAIAFSPRGGTIDILLTEADGLVELAVSDAGPGVPDYAQGRVFERFYSLPRPDSGKKSTGLGLALVREVAKLHGGNVTLETRPEGGAVARLTLRRSQP